MKTVICIPSRLGSSRFPLKPFAVIDGEIMLHRVINQCKQTLLPVYVLTPDQEIVDRAQEAGVRAELTSSLHMTGTDRLAEFAKRHEFDVYINVQGDEPLINPVDILAIAQKKQMFYNDVIGSMHRADFRDVGNNNTVKVIENAGQLIGLTRKGESRYTQSGLYAFNRQELLDYGAYPDKSGALDRNENIELMRFCEMGRSVKMIVVDKGIAVDIPEDIKSVEEVLKNGERSE